MRGTKGQSPGNESWVENSAKKFLSSLGCEGLRFTTSFLLSSATFTDDCRSSLDTIGCEFAPVACTSGRNCSLRCREYRLFDFFLAMLVVVARRDG